MVLTLAFLAAPIATPAADLRIQSLDSTGQLTFNRISTGQAYRVECATSLTGAWSRLTNAVTIDGIPTTMNCIPGPGRGGIATGAVPVTASAMFFRVVADTNDLAFIPAGEFLMGTTTNAGSGEFQHTVYVSPFYMGRYEVTKALWDSVCAWAATHGYTDLLNTTQVTNKGPTHPMQRVGWYTAAKWCNARSEMERLTPCFTNANGSVFRLGLVGNGTITIPIGCNWNANGYRFPTEAEWEKAARGGFSGHRFPWSDTDTIQQTRANYYASTNKSAYEFFDTNPTAGYHPAYTNGGKPYTSPVGTFAPNGYGLYDMAGNANEWCWDFYSDTYYTTSPNIDPRGPPPNLKYERVLHDGSWGDGSFSSQTGARNHDRTSDNPLHRYQCFRIARSFTNTVPNQAPVIVEGANTNVILSEDSAPTPFRLTLHATDADGDPIGWWVLTPASNGKVTASGSGASMPIAYQPTANYNGSDSFVVQAYDTWGAKTSITVNVTIQPVNDPSVANAQLVTVATNTPRAITLTGSEAAREDTAKGMQAGRGFRLADTPTAAAWADPIRVAAVAVAAAAGPAARAAPELLTAWVAEEGPDASMTFPVFQPGMPAAAVAVRKWEAAARPRMAADREGPGQAQVPFPDRPIPVVAAVVVRIIAMAPAVVAVS